MSIITTMETKQRAPGNPPLAVKTAFGYPRDFLENRFVYLVVSPRANGMSVGVNLNPDKRCNFDCLYCEVNRSEPPRESNLDVTVMVNELESTLDALRSGRIRQRPQYQRLPAALCELRHVALSGDGEPTLSPHFGAAIEAIVHLRSLAKFRFFKLVLLTNGSYLDRQEVIDGLSLLTQRDEVWVKLEAGSQHYMTRVNKTDCSIETILANILTLARRRPVIIQSLFPAVHGEGPAAGEIEAYVQRLKSLKDAGAQIPLVQIYSATRPTAQPQCGHLPLALLSGIARRVKEVTGLKAEVF